MTGCNSCTPYCWRPKHVIGYGLCCSDCGRLLPEDELILIASHPLPPRRHENPFGRGIRKDERGLPYLDTNGQPLRLGEPFDPRKYGTRTPTIGVR